MLNSLFGGIKKKNKTIKEPYEIGKKKKFSHLCLRCYGSNTDMKHPFQGHA